MKVIFLDFDGVLVNKGSLLKARSSKGAPECVAALNRVLTATGAAIVISSSWRLDFDPGELQEILAAWGVEGEVLGTTPQLKSRDLEIAQWIDRNGPVESFVILDDDSVLGGLASRLVLTSCELGLTEQDADRAITLLRSGYHQPAS